MYRTLCVSLLMALSVVPARAVPADAPIVATPNVISPSDPRIQYTGRIDFTNPDAPKMYWPGTQIAANFRGTSLAIRLDDPTGQNYFNVIVDGDDTKPVVIGGDKTATEFPVVTGLKDRVHSVVVFRRTDMGPASMFRGFVLDPGKSLAKPPRRPSRRIEFYGDSITTGWGNEGVGGNGTAANTNNYLAYGAVTARALKAEYVCISRSGLGITTGYDDNPAFSMIQTYYDTLDPMVPHSWDFTRWTPDVVVVNLGENDNGIYLHKRHPDPGPDAIVSQYAAFVKAIRGHYPKAKIFCVLGPMDAVRSAWPGYIQTAVKSLNDQGDPDVYFTKMDTRLQPEFTGGSGHPGVADDQAAANVLTAFIRSKTGWK